MIALNSRDNKDYCFKKDYSNFVQIGYNDANTISRDVEKYAKVISYAKSKLQEYHKNNKKGDVVLDDIIDDNQYINNGLAMIIDLRCKLRNIRKKSKDNFFYKLGFEFYFSRHPNKFRAYISTNKELLGH